MNEYIIPLEYSGQGAGLTVMLAGLESDVYEKLELSIDGHDFFEIMRNLDDPSCSIPHIFQRLTPGQVYKVIGRITVDSFVSATECMIPAVYHQPAPVLKTRNTPQHHGGGMSKPMSKPKVVNS